MKQLLKKSLKLSLASIIVLKAGDFTTHRNKYFTYNSLPASSLYEDTSDDIIANIMRTEFNTEQLEKISYKFKSKYDFQMKKREDHLKELMDPNTQYDMLIIGGGCNGAGVALDASSRGLKCAVIDAYDFASGTSSRSTKMAHGGVRYFEQMMKLQGDPFENFELLKETLNERNYFLQAVPFQCRQLDLVIPSSSFFWTVFFYYPGMMLYHMIYIRQLMKSKYDVAVDGPKILNRKKLSQMFYKLKSIHGNYGLLMHEIQMMDTRMNWHALLTASIDEYVPGMKGTTLANYVEFQSFIKNADGQIEGAVLYDKIKKKQFNVKSKVIVNCAGIYADEIRLKDQPDCGRRIAGARGTHLMFDKNLLPLNTGIIIPKTKDGRLLYIINYLNHAMVGTTDEKCDITHTVAPTQQDIDFIIHELKSIFGNDFDYEKSLKSAWAGIRPLVVETQADKELKKIADQEQYQRKSLLQKSADKFKNVIRWFGRKMHGQKDEGSTAQLSRNHVIEFSKSGLVSLMGGKWTTFRKMGVETVDLILKENPNIFEPKYDFSQTLYFNLAGSYSKVFVSDGVKIPNEQLFEQYEDHFVFQYDIPRECARNLVHSYGTMALRVVRLGETLKLNQRIHPDYPFLKSELAYAIKYEMVEKPNDLLCRRLPIAIIDKNLALELLPSVVDMMAKEKNWSTTQKTQELEEAKQLIEYMK